VQNFVVPPIKGLLRFWWRAVCGIEDIKDMAYWEGEIFGSTEKKSKSRSGLKISMPNHDLNVSLRGKRYRWKERAIRTSIIHYLAYGFYERQGREMSSLRVISPYNHVSRSFFNSPKG